MIGYLLYRIGEWLALSVPLKTAYKVAVFFSKVHYPFAFADRSAVTRNLKIIFPEKSGKEIYAIRRMVFCNFAKYLADFLRFKKVDMEYIKKNIRLKGLENIDDGLKAGKGVILVTAHFGNWELGGGILAMLGIPLISVALPHKAASVNRFFDSQRQNKGMRILPLGRAAKGCIRALKENRVLALLGDRDFTGSGKVMDFFGKPTLLPQGPAALVLQTGAAILPGFTLRNDDDTVTVIIEKPLEYVLSGNKEEDMRTITAECKAVFERYIRAYPQQWYMFRRFWKE